MCSSNTSEEKLFAKTVPVSITDKFSTNFRSLFLSIEWHQAKSLIMKKELFITLTDNNDPFFLYNLQLSDDDFQRLKNSQNLLMDFSAFPQNIIHFLELCLNEAKEPQPNYLLHLTIGETVSNTASTAQLDIEQSSVFRQVSLLSLKFLAATESTLKQHLTLDFRNLKEENRRLQNQLCHCEKKFRDRVSELESELEKKSEDLESSKRELNAEISKRESIHAHILMEEREKLLNKQREGEDRLESERIDKETKLKKDIDQLETRLSCLERLNKELENKKIELERQLSEQRSYNLTVETELRIKSETLMITEKKNSELLDDYKEANGRINHLMSNIKDLNENLKRKETQITGMHEDLDNCKKEKKKIAIGLNAVEEQLKKENKVRKEAENDQYKANQIIEKLQNVVFQENNKIQALSNKSIQLEEVLREKNQSIQCLQKELDEERETNQSLAVRIHQIPMYQEKIAELEGENRNLNLVVNGLNRLLQENGIITEYNPPPNFSEKFPICETINGKVSGDNDVQKKEDSSPLISTVQLKSVPSRLPDVENGLKPRQMRTNFSPDSTNRRQMDTSLINQTSKVSTIVASDKNVNQSNLDMISSGLSKEFSDINVSKHSTARKQINKKS